MKESIRIKANVMTKINDLAMPGEIVIFGSTYMSGFPLYELVNKCTFENAVYNRSINGLTVREALEIAQDCVISIRPCKIFLALGEEDEGEPDVLDKYNTLVSLLRTKLPECELYLIGLTGKGEYTESFNKNIRKLCDGKRIKFIDFVTKNISDTALYRARFKQLSCFFRSEPITPCEAFAISSI